MKNTMIMNTVSQIPLRKTLVADFILLSAAVALPAVCHAAGCSIQYLEPMRIALLAGMLLVDDRRNAYLLALALPLFSMLAVGFPMGGKCGLMMVELAANVWIFGRLRSHLGDFGSMLLAVVLSKALYYGLKLLIFGAAAATVAVPLQLVATALMAAAFALAACRVRP